MNFSIGRERMLSDLVVAGMARRTQEAYLPVRAIAQKSFRQSTLNATPIDFTTTSEFLFGFPLSAIGSQLAPGSLNTKLEDILQPPCPRCVERGRDARKSDDATHVAEE